MSREIILITILFLIEVTNAQQYVGRSCKLPHNGENGQCAYYSNCQAAQDLYARGVRVSVCGQYMNSYIVCCPIQQTRWLPTNQWSNLGSQTVQTPTTTYRPVQMTRRPALSRVSTRSPQFGVKRMRVSEQKCSEYKSIGVEELTVSSLSLRPSIRNLTTDSCDYAAGLIVGGKAAKKDEFPHMAAIGWRFSDGSSAFKCGGSLISERFVLTAAHCSFDPQSRSEPSFVRLGQTDLTSRYGVDLSIEKFIKHESYHSSQRYFDIALIKLSRDVALSKSIKPACLWQTPGLSHSKAIATGWGALKTYGETSDKLMKVELDIKDNAICSDQFEDDPSLPNGATADFICAGSNKGKDTCQGDSGAPLQIVKNDSICQFHIIGLTSFAPPLCGSKNSVAGYTRVSYFLDWIEGIVW